MSWRESADREPITLPRTLVRDLRLLADQCRADGCHVSAEELVEEMVEALIDGWAKERRRRA